MGCGLAWRLPAWPWHPRIPGWALSLPLLPGHQVGVEVCSCGSLSSLLNMRTSVPHPRAGAVVTPTMQGTSASAFKQPPTPHVGWPRASRSPPGKPPGCRGSCWAGPLHPRTCAPALPRPPRAPGQPLPSDRCTTNSSSLFQLIPRLRRPFRSPLESSCSQTSPCITLAERGEGNTRPHPQPSNQQAGPGPRICISTGSG